MHLLCGKLGLQIVVDKDTINDSPGHISKCINMQTLGTSYLVQKGGFFLWPYTSLFGRLGKVAVFFKILKKNEARGL